MTGVAASFHSYREGVANFSYPFDHLVLDDLKRVGMSFHHGPEPQMAQVQPCLFALAVLQNCKQQTVGKQRSFFTAMLIHSYPFGVLNRVRKLSPYAYGLR